MSQKKTATPGSQLHRQHLAGSNKTSIKETAGSSPQGDLYEISPIRTEAAVSNKKKVSNFSFGKTSQQKTEEMKKKEIASYQEQVKRISFADYTYENYPALPLVSFFPLITRKTTAAKFVPVTAKLRLPIPDTFVFIGKEEVKMWLLTSEEGYLEKIESFSNRDMMLAVGRPKGQENVLTAVMKVKTRKGTANEITMLNTEDLKNIILSPPNGDYVIQRFVQSKGLHPTLTRVVWRQAQSCTAYTLTGKSLFTDDTEGDFRKRFTVCTDIPLGCTIFRTTGTSIREPVTMTEEIVRYVQRQQGLRLKELVADFIKDAADKWWFIQVKSFRVTEECLKLFRNIAAQRASEGGDVQAKSLIPHANKKQEYVKLSRCKCCNAMCNPADLIHELTFKMIVQTINHLSHRGESIPFFNRTDLKVRDQLNMTRVFKVCNFCFDLYTAEKRLIGIEQKFASAIGIKLVSNDAGEIQVVPPEHMSLQQSTSSQDLIKAHPKVKLYRLLICLQSAFNLPQGEYTIAYELGGRTIFFPVATEEPTDAAYTADSEKLETVVRLSKFQVHYFVADPEMFQDFIQKSQQTIRIVVLSGVHKNLNTARLPTKADREAARDANASTQMGATQHHPMGASAVTPTRTGTLRSSRAASPHQFGQTQKPMGSTQMSAAGNATSLAASAGANGGNGTPEEAPAPSAAVSQAFFGEFPIPIKQFNPQLDTNRMDFIIDLEKLVTEDDSIACPQLKTTVAFAPCSSQDMMTLKEMPLWPINGVYFPHLSFFTCEPLPDDWVLLLPRTRAMLSRPMKFFPRTGYDTPVDESSAASSPAPTSSTDGADDASGATPFFTDDNQPLPVFREHMARIDAKRNRGKKPAARLAAIAETDQTQTGDGGSGADWATGSVKAEWEKDGEGKGEGEAEGETEGGEGKGEGEGGDAEYAEVSPSKDDDGTIPTQEVNEGDGKAEGEGEAPPPE